MTGTLDDLEELAVRMEPAPQPSRQFGPVAALTRLKSLACGVGRP